MPLLRKVERPVPSSIWAMGLALVLSFAARAEIPTLSHSDPDWPLDARTAFLLSAPQDEGIVVDTLRWTGRFFKGEPEPVGQFTFRIYEDSAGEPGETLVEVGVSDFASQEIDRRTFSYGSILHRMVIPAGSSVWIEVQARSPAVPQWGILDILTPGAGEMRLLRAPEMGVNHWTWFPWFHDPAVEGSTCDAFQEEPPEMPEEDPVEDFLVPRVDPNPTTGVVRIRMLLDRARYVEAAIFDVTGRRVRTLADEWRTDGPVLMIWNGRTDDGRDLRSGIYFLKVRLDSRSFIQRKLLLLREGG